MDVTSLYPHNLEAFEKVMQQYHTSKKAAVVHACGTGKSYIIAAVAEAFKRVLVVAPNNFVLNETKKVCHGGCEFRTYASVMHDEGEADKYDIIVLDEFHRSGAEKWGIGVQKLISINPDAKLLGTSATNIRYLDGARNMADELFDGNVVSHLPLGEAIERGILPCPTYVSSIYTMDETVKTYKKRISLARKTGLDKDELCRHLDGIASNWENAGGVSAIIRKYITHDMHRIIVFCSKVARAAEARKLLGKWFGIAGFNKVRYYNIDYQEKRLEKEMKDFQAPMGDYDLKVAISVNMLNEGVHIPHVDGVIMLRSTISRIIMEQQFGRCLTSNNSNITPVILDLVNNMDLARYGNVTFESAPDKGEGELKEKENDHLPFKVIDECRDIRILLQQIDGKIGYRSYTKKECLESAMQYGYVKDWRRYQSAIYHYSAAKGWLKECTAHMKRLINDYSFEECLESAQKYERVVDWVNGARNHYRKAREKGWLDKCCAHMKKRKVWTIEACKESARRYSKAGEWQKNEGNAYSAARKHGWLEECKAHMEVIRCCYTKEECITIAKKYNRKGDWFKFDNKSYNTAFRHGWLEECCAHMPPSRQEKCTKEECLSVARKYNNKTDFFKNERKIYSCAYYHGWLKECTAHMPKTMNIKYTLESCIKSAKAYKTRGEWLKAEKKMYNAAYARGWLNECCAHMIKRRKA